MILQTRVSRLCLSRKRFRTHRPDKMGEVSERATIRFSRFLQRVSGRNSSAGISIVVTMLLAKSRKLMMSAAVVSNLRVLWMRPVSCRGLIASPRLSVECRSSVYISEIRHRLSPSGITTTPVSKPDKPSASFGKTISAVPIIRNGLRYVLKQQRSSNSKAPLDALRSRRSPTDDHRQVQNQINRHQKHCDSDRFLKATQENRAERCDQDQSDNDSMMQKIEVLDHKRILDDVCCCVRC